jgi:hypothetical protein
MSEVLKATIEYREKGEKKETIFNIDFVSNWCIREYSDIMALSASVKMKWDRISDLRTEMMAISIEKPEGFREKSKEKKAELETLNKDIISFSENDFLKRRYELIETLLRDNGITDEKFFSFDFWDRCVEPSQVIKFITDCVYKDMGKKKIQ